MLWNKRQLTLAAVVLGSSGCGLEALFFGSITPARAPYERPL